MVQNAQTENLKTLIQASGILSASEKSEWLALLDLMNQKQLAELEKILASAPEPKISNEKFQIPNTAAKPPVVQPLPKPVSVPQTPPQMPKLSHIMNLPNLGNLGASAVPPKPTLTPAIQQTAQPQQKNKAGFADRIKLLFTEKELPPGEAEKELAQQSPVPTATPVQARPVVMPKPITSAPAQPASFGLVEKARPEAQPLRGLNNRPSIINRPKPPLPPETTVRNPGSAPEKPVAEANFAAIDEKIQSEIMAAIKDNHPGMDNLPKAQASNLALEDLGDLTLLSNKVLQGTDFNSLVSKVRDLVKSHGYFDVIFNLEKSPLYINYIKTGQELLSSGSGFEQLQDGEHKDFLTRQQFEKLADLLRQIQVG